MKKIPTIILSVLATAPLIFNTPQYAAASETSAVQSAPPARTAEERVMIRSDDISFQYVSTVYNGEEQKPGITVTSGNTVLKENTDFTVKYPADCVNVGKKTITIQGIGNYKGRYSSTYRIEPVDCSEKNGDVKIEVADCFYSGIPLTPDVTVTVNGITLGIGDYSLEYYDNINTTASEKPAKCDITFRGNFSGSRTVEFDISKAPSKDFELQLMVRNGERVVYDLTPLKSPKASFGQIKYYAWDFVAEHQPKIAFNELIFTVPEKLSGGTAVVIPVINDPDREDHNIVIYPTTTDKIIPTAVIRSADREYNGEPISADVFSSNGSYVSAEGRMIDGTWEFWTEPPTLPCDKQPCVVTFTPSDPRYCPIDAAVFVTISRAEAEDFAVKANRTELSQMQSGQIVISGIPEDYKGSVTLSCDEKCFITELFCKDPTQREYVIDYPETSGKFTYTAKLSGDGQYMPASLKCSITVGDYAPPEDKPADKITTPGELAALIGSAAEDSTVKAEGMRTVPADLVKAASDKRLTLEIKLNDNYTWIVDTTKLSGQGELDLDITTAVIPAILLNKIGGENPCSFNVFENNLGSGAKLQVSVGYRKNLSANLYLYNTAGELKFVSCAPVGLDGSARLEISASGKYAVITDIESKLAGDLNNDCKISLNDITALLKEYVSMIPPRPKPEGKYLKYDVDGNGTFDLSDVTLLLKKFVNKT